METRKKAKMPIIGMFQQPFKKEIELQLQTLLHRLVFQDPNRSNRCSSKHGNRGGQRKSWSFGVRTDDERGTVRHPCFNVKNAVMFDAAFVFSQAVGNRLHIVFPCPRYGAKRLQPQCDRRRL